MTQCSRPVVRWSVLLVVVCALVLWTACRAGERSGPAGDDSHAATSSPPQDGRQAEGLRSTMYHYTMAIEAERGGDYPKAQEQCAAALGFAPYNPALLFIMARIEARLGNTEASLARLRQVAEIGATFDPMSSEAFAGVAALDAFKPIAERLAANRLQHSPAEVVVTLADPELWPEGIAFDPTTRDLYIGSITKKKIVRLRPDGAVEDFGSSADDGLMGLLGMQVDDARRRLWVCTGDGSDELVTSGERRRNAVVSYDLETARLLRVLPLAESDDGKNRLLNDLAIAPDGTVYVTESNQGELYRITPEDGELRLYRAYPDLNYLNGIAISADGRMLWVAAVEGIQVIDLASGEASPLQHGDGITTVSADGLQVFGNSLIAVQNQAALSFRVVRFFLDARGRRILRHEVLPSGLPAGLIPYTCAVGDAEVYVNGTGSFDLRDRGETPANPVVVRVPLLQS